MTKFIISLGILLALSVLSAHAIDVQGVFKQGGFIYGTTFPNAHVRMGELATRADEKGVFTFGIERNHGPVAEIVVDGPQGEVKDVVFIEARTYQTQRIDGIPKRKVTPNEADMTRIREDNQAIASARDYKSQLHAFQGTFITPTKGRISGVYGSRRVFNGQERSWHKGLDLAAPTGTPIVAPAEGVVRLALADSFFNGNLVIVDHGYNLMTIYAHMDRMDVKVGQRVAQGDMLGTVGTTGRSTGPHLHWGLYWRNMALDPQYLLNSKGETAQ